MATSSTASLKSAATGAPPPEEQKPRTAIDLFSSKKVQDGLRAVAGQFLTPDKLLRLSINAIHRTPKLLQCDPATVLGAVMMTAALGLEPNTPQQLAFLIPYKRSAKVNGRWVETYECQYQIGARGFITLAYRSPYVKSLQAEAVRQGDKFEHMQGSDAFLRYQKALSGRGPLQGSWCLVKMTSGEEVAAILPVDEVYKIRGRSETFRALQVGLDRPGDEKDLARAKQKFNEQPWVMWEDDMAAKSAIKKVAKRLPLSPNDALQIGATIDDRQDVRGGALDLRAMADVETVRSVFEGEDPPMLDDDPSDTLETSGEQFSTRERQGVAASANADGEVPPPPAAAKTTTPAPAPRARSGRANAPEASPPAAAPVQGPKPADERPSQPDLVRTYGEEMRKAGTRDKALEFLDEARSTLNAAEFAIVTKAYHSEWPEGR